MLVVSKNQCLETCSLVTNRRLKRDRSHLEKAQMKVLTFDKLNDLTINQLTCESVPSFIYEAFKGHRSYVEIFLRPSLSSSS